jgi:hypothetical protein
MERFCLLDVNEPEMSDLGGEFDSLVEGSGVWFSHRSRERWHARELTPVAS